jgi:hypothetical protein
MLRAEQCARASSTAGSIFSQGCISPLPAYELSEMTCRDSLPRSTEAVLWSSELTRCVNTTAVLHGLAESMGLRGYYPSDRRITSCPKTRLYLIIFFVSSSSTILQRLKCLCHFPANLANCAGSLLQRTPVYSPQVPSCFSAHGSSSTCTTSSS